jgi:hypothetical protein
MEGIVQLRAPAVSAPAPAAQRRRAARRRLKLLVGAIATLLALAAVALAVLVAGGTATAGPATGAAAVVPGDALAYIHVSTDRGRAQVQQAIALARKFPDFPRLTATLLGRLAAIVGGSGSATDAELRPWIGRDAALAFLNTTSASADSLLVFGVSDQPQARAMLTRGGAVPVGRYRSVTLLRYPSGTELAFVHHYLVAGDDPAVRAAIDASSGAVSPLSHTASYRKAAQGEPADRVVDGYASAAGVRRILGARGGVLGAVGMMLSSPSLAAVTFSVSPASRGARLSVHSVLDPTLSQVGGHSPSTFVPSLQNDIPAGSPLVLDLAGLGSAAPRLLSAAASAGIAPQAAPLLQRLGGALRAEGFDLAALRSIFSGESAVAVVPSPTASRPPALAVIAQPADQAKASQTLASLEVPLAQLFAVPAAGAGGQPVFTDRQVAGVTAHQLTLTPGLQLDYAVFHGLVVISTSLDAIAAVASAKHAIGQEQEFRQTLAGRPQRVGSLLFLDSSQLLSLGEQMGITGGARFQALRQDLAQIRAVGLSSTSGEDDTTAELYLQIP